MPGKNFNEITIGTGTLTLDAVNVGYIENAKLKYESEIMEKWYGVPSIRAGIIPIKNAFEMEVKMDQINADNMKYALGGLTPVGVLAAEVDKTASFESLTAAVDSGHPGIRRTKLGPTAYMLQWVAISTGGDKPVIKNVADTVTYAENDDYIVDYSTGYVYWNPAGTNIAVLTGDSYVTKNKYKYTPYASQRLDLGAQYSQQDFLLEFVHTNPTTSKDITVVIWKAMAKPNFEWEFSDANTLSLAPTFYATDDSANHATSPYGYILIEE